MPYVRIYLKKKKKKEALNIQGELNKTISIARHPEYQTGPLTPLRI